MQLRQHPLWFGRRPRIADVVRVKFAADGGLCLDLTILTAVIGMSDKGYCLLLLLSFYLGFGLW